MQVKDLLKDDPFRKITTVVRVDDHDSETVWREMYEYVPTDAVKSHCREGLEVLLETRQGATERACVWVSGFFGSGKSHFLKALGYLLEDRELRDSDGCPHRSVDFLCRKLGLENYLPILASEFRIQVLFINLLEYDPQSPQSPTISRAVYRRLLEQKGLSREFWVAAWEQELQGLGKWQEFLRWVTETYGRPWEDERRLNAEAVLKRALPKILSDRYHSEDEAARAVHESKRTSETVEQSTVVAALRGEAERLDERRGRVVVLLDEVGLYIGDNISRLTDLNTLAEQVVRLGDGKIVLVVTAQEALTDLVPRLTRDRQILEWLRDRFRLRFGLEPTEVERVVAQRLLAKTGEGERELKDWYKRLEGRLRANLSIDRNWTSTDLIEQYPCPPHAIRLVQDIMGAMRGSVEEARRLSGRERSMLKLTQVLLTGEGGLLQGASQEVGWLAGLDRFYDALAPDLSVIRSEQVGAIRQLAALGEVNGLSLERVAKAVFLLQQVSQRHPCTLENVTSALVDHAESDTFALRRAVQEALEKLKQSGWLAEEQGQFRLLTPAEHDLEREVRQHFPSPAETKDGFVDVLRGLLRQFKYEHGQIRRPLKAKIAVDGETLLEGADLMVELFSPFASESAEELLTRSIAEPKTLFWKAGEDSEIRGVLERTLAIEKGLKHLPSLPEGDPQTTHRERLERELQNAKGVRLPELAQQAFQVGRIFVAGQEIQVSGNRKPVPAGRDEKIARQVYTEFVDDRPERDEDSAAILGWRPGQALPAFYSRRGLISAGQQIQHDVGIVKQIKEELRRREQRGLPATGKDLLEYYERAPYGWDPRLLRAALATLFKAGLLAVQLQNRNITDPTDVQVRSLFYQDKEFRRTGFLLLAEVDWRQASALCSQFFGVQGGDTFARTAVVVQEQATVWAARSDQLATRCGDNGLPAAYSSGCREAQRMLQEVAQLADPVGRLRRFLEHEAALAERVPQIRALEQFAFQDYRQIRDFTQAVSDWAGPLADEAARRWRQLQDDLTANDLPSRWNQLKDAFSFLLRRYREDYRQAHAGFHRQVGQTISELEQHPAFQAAPQLAEERLQPQRALRCSQEDSAPAAETHRCPGCGRSWPALAPHLIGNLRRRTVSELDGLLPKPKEEKAPPLSLRREVTGEEELENLFEQIRSYQRRWQRPLEVQAEVRVREG